MRGITVLTDKRAVARFREKPGIDERAEDGLARGLVESPQSSRLLRRQPQPWHFQKLSTNPSHNLLNTSRVVSHSSLVDRLMLLLEFTCDANEKRLRFRPVELTSTIFDASTVGLDDSVPAIVHSVISRSSCGARPSTSSCVPTRPSSPLPTFVLACDAAGRHSCSPRRRCPRCRLLHGGGRDRVHRTDRETRAGLPLPLGEALPNAIWLPNAPAGAVHLESMRPHNLHRTMGWPLPPSPLTTAS